MLVLLFGLVTAFWLRARPTTTSYDQQRSVTRLERLAAMRQEEDSKVSSYAWVDKAKGVARIPVSQAMELVTAELKAKPVQASAVPVENPYPAGLATPAPAAPAPAAAPAVQPAAQPAAATPGAKP